MLRGPAALLGEYDAWLIAEGYGAGNGLLVARAVCAIPSACTLRSASSLAIFSHSASCRGCSERCLLPNLAASSGWRLPRDMPPPWRGLRCPSLPTTGSHPWLRYTASYGGSDACLPSPGSLPQTCLTRLALGPMEQSWASSRTPPGTSGAMCPEPTPLLTSRGRKTMFEGIELPSPTGVCHARRAPEHCLCGPR